MADLTTSSVVVNRTWNTTLSNGTVMYSKAVSMTLSTHGSASSGELILASAFGLTSIEEVSTLVKSDDTILIVGGPNAARSAILLKAAGTNAPASVTGVYACVVKGY